MNKLSDSTFELDALDFAFMTEWLAQQFICPPDAEHVRLARSIQGQVALHWIGTALDRQDAAEGICHELAAGTVEAVAVALQRRHTTLFEGIFRQRCLPPYASVWDGTGRLFGAAVDRTLHQQQTLNVHLDPGCIEPADHISIQLATLAEALRQDRTSSIAILIGDIRSWAPRFAAALTQADSNGFYGHIAQLLIALMQRLSSAYPIKNHRSAIAEAPRT